MARSLGFEPKEAIKDIGDVFWRQGYEATSMQDIEDATGLKKQSLYRLFNDKRGMYLAALQHYDEAEIGDGGPLSDLSITAPERFERLFQSIIDDVVASGDRRGCFLCNAAAEQAQLDPATAEKVNAMMFRSRGLFIKALGDHEPYASDEQLKTAQAEHLLSGYFGLRILIKSDMPEATLRNAARALVASI
ncbi:MAG: TetR/AcrR family transcriptional regulator [Pseudomonadota bacterium]